MKKFFTFLLILLVIVGFLVWDEFYLFRKLKSAVVYQAYMVPNQDIVISLEEILPISTGYASTLDSYYIDINNNKIYCISDYNIWGVAEKPFESGSHYSLTKTIRLSDAKMNELMGLLKPDSRFRTDNLEDAMTGSSRYYFQIQYQNEHFYLTGEGAKIMDSYLNQ